MNSKQKGARGEREFAAFCREQGYDVRRTAQYCGNTGDAADVVGLPGIHVEVKRVERLDLDKTMSQAIHDAQKKGAIPCSRSQKKPRRMADNAKCGGFLYHLPRMGGKQWLMTSQLLNF